MKWIMNFDLNQNELQNARIQNLATAPSSPVKGQIYFNTASNTYFGYNGSSWIDLGQVLTGDSIITLINACSSLIDDNNLSTNVNDAINKKHTQNTDTQLTGSGTNTINTTGTGDIVDFELSGTKKSGIDNSGNFTGNSATASKLATARTITLAGDVSGSASFDGSANPSITATLANSGVTAGTYPKVTVDAKGRVTGGTTLSATDVPSITHDKVSDFDTGVRTNTLNQMATPTSDVSMGSHKITNLADPTNANDAVNKEYADNLRAGISIKDPVACATTSALPTNTYSNGVITASAVGVLTIDGYTPVLNDRILVKNEATGANNGIYYVSTLGTASVAFVLTRTNDADNSPSGEVVEGMAVWVDNGTANINSRWILTTSGTITLGTTSLTFTKDLQSADLTGANGITKSGNQFGLTSGICTTGTFKSVTVDTYGRVTAGSNPTTLAGFGITDAVRKYSATFGDGSSSSFTITHNLGTTDITCSVWEVSTGALVMADVKIVNSNSVTITTGTPVPTSGQYRIVITG